MPVLLAEAAKRSAAAASQEAAGAAKTAQSRPSSDPKSDSSLGTPDRSSEQAAWNAQTPLPDDWKVLVPDGAGSGRVDGPNGSREMALRPPSAEPKPGLTLDAICKKLDVPQDKCTVVNADALLHNAGRHNWPPIIPLKEADGYYFIVGSAEASAEFEVKLRKAVVPEIQKYAREFQTDVIEVVGHTDEQPIKGLSSNLDATAFDVLLRGGGAAKMSVSDNAGLGFARAAAIVQILRSEPELKGMIILPLSAAQVVDTTGKLADGSSGGDVKQRRRIEIRLRQSEPSK